MRYWLGEMVLSTNEEVRQDGEAKSGSGSSSRESRGVEAPGGGEAAARSHGGGGGGGGSAGSDPAGE